MKNPLIQLTSVQARRIWLHAQRLDTRQKLLAQRWNWIGRGASRAHQQQVEAALHKFEQFQLCRS
ncbi:MAG: hypothetical protein WBW98_12060 [Candidatus Sulfotelmatobacter sp.]